MVRQQSGRGGHGHMASTRSRLTRVGLAFVLAGVGVVAYDAVTQVAGAQPPPVIDTDFGSYPFPGAVPATCAVGGGGAGVLQGYRAFIVRAGQPPNADPFVDPGPGAPFADRSMVRFQADLQVGDQIVLRWTNWTPGCEGLVISFPLKATNEDHFDLFDDQALVRQPNTPTGFPFCTLGGPDTCANPSQPGGGFQLTNTLPQLSIVCGFQLDVIIGGPLETVGPHGSYYQTANRASAAAAGLGTFNTNPPNMLIDRANGAMPCTTGQRITIDKQWVGTGAQPPVNVPPEFLLTVTSSASQTDLTPIGTASCTVVNGLFACDYRDAADPTMPQAGLLVTNNSLLTVTETGFPGNTFDITFPVGMSSEFISCQNISGPCLLRITNTPPPPPDTTTTTAPPDTTAPTTS